MFVAPCELDDDGSDGVRWFDCAVWIDMVGVWMPWIPVPYLCGAQGWWVVCGGWPVVCWEGGLFVWDGRLCVGMTGLFAGGWPVVCVYSRRVWWICDVCDICGLRRGLVELIIDDY